MSESMCEREFRERYRFLLINIQFILNLIRPSLITMTRRSKAVSPLLQLLVALRYFATGSFFRLIGDSVGLSEATVSRCVHRVATALCGIGRRYISFPTDWQLLKTKQEFYNLSSKSSQLSLGYVRPWPKYRCTCLTSIIDSPSEFCNAKIETDIRMKCVFKLSYYRYQICFNLASVAIYTLTFAVHANVSKEYF